MTGLAVAVVTAGAGTMGGVTTTGWTVLGMEMAAMVGPYLASTMGPSTQAAISATPIAERMITTRAPRGERFWEYSNSLRVIASSPCKARNHESSYLGPRALCQSFRNARREISENPIRSGTFEGNEAFRHRLLAVEPPIARRSHDHGIFARDLIGESRPAEGVL